MLARDQNLLLRPNASPSTGFRHVHRSLRLARAWQKLGGTAALAHADLPGSLIRQLNKLQIEFLPATNTDRGVSTSTGNEPIAPQCVSGWIVVDGTSGQSRFDRPEFDCSAVKRVWKLAAIEQWPDTMVSRHGKADFLISPDSDGRQTDHRQARCVLDGDRYRIPTIGNDVSVSELDVAACPRQATKILLWLSDRTSTNRLAQTVADVIETAVDRTSIDVIGSPRQRDCVELVRLKKANPKVTLRFWGSVERRLQSMIPVQLAIVDNEKNSVALGMRGIPVCRLSSFVDGSEVQSKAAKPTELKLDASGRSKFRRSVGRLIRDRDHRQDLTRAGLASFDQQAADRVARRLASDHLKLESAVPKDWPTIRRWRSDPESRACALRRIDLETDEGQRCFTSALNRPSSSRLMFRLPCGQSVGIASLDRPERSGNGQIHVGILIKPSFRNQGYGSALLERVIDRLAANGGTRQMIIQTTANHRAAHQMARKAGMTPVAPTVVDGGVAHQFGLELQDSQRSTFSLPTRKSA